MVDGAVPEFGGREAGADEPGVVLRHGRQVPPEQRGPQREAIEGRPALALGEEPPRVPPLERLRQQQDVARLQVVPQERRVVRRQGPAGLNHLDGQVAHGGNGRRVGPVQRPLQGFAQ